VIVTPQLGKKLPVFMGEEKDLETASVRVGNQAVLSPEEQRVSRFDQSVAGLQAVSALKVNSAVGFTARCQPVFRVMNGTMTSPASKLTSSLHRESASDSLNPP